MRYKFFKSVFVFTLLLALVLVVACKKDFLTEYNKLVLSKQSQNSTYAKENKDYFVSIADDNELLVLPNLIFPSNLTASKALYNNRVELSWEPILDEAKNISYRVYRKTASESNDVWQLLGETKECNYSDTVSEENDLDGKEFFYSVRAIYKERVESEIEKEDGSKEVVTIDSVTGSRLSYYETGYILSNINSLSISFREYYDKIQLEWNKVVGAECYEIFRAAPISENQLGEFVHVATTKSLTHTDYSNHIEKSEANLVASREYHYKVFPVNKQKVKALDCKKTLEVLGAFLAVGAPIKPVLKSVSKGEYGSGILLKWETVSDATFKVYRSATPSGPFSLVESKIDGDSYLDRLTNVADKDRSKIFYYRISSLNSIADSPLSDFDQELHSGELFYLPGDAIKIAKSIYPKGLYLSSTLPASSDVKLALSYSNDNNVWQEINGDGLELPLSNKLLQTISDYNSSKDYFFKLRLVKSSAATSPAFTEDELLLGKSNLIEIKAKNGGPLLPDLTVSQGDHTIAGKISISGKWDLSDYQDYVEFCLTRYYSFGKERGLLSKPIEVVSKTIANFGEATIRGGEFTIIDNITVDINPTSDIVLPMNATINKGDGWSYWSWDREAWKYIKRKLPFDMRKAVGCEYKITVRWRQVDDSWEESSLPGLVYGYPALTDDEFAHLGLWLREVAMNRLWHILYPPYEGELSTTLELLTSAQTKRGEYSGEVGFYATADGLGGKGKCWIRNYSDWGEEYRINLEKPGESFDIVLKYKDIATFDMPLSIRTPLYSGDIHAVFKLENGLYCDKPKAGSYMIVTQTNRPSTRYDNLEREGSLVLKYFPPLSYEQRRNPNFSGTPSYELTTINFKYSINEWVQKRNEDWTMYYGFKFD